MKAVTKQPNPSELQYLQQLFHTGQLQQTESQARLLLKRYPKSLIVLNILGMSQQAQNKLPEAAESFRKMLAIDAGIAEIHFNLAAIQTQRNDKKAAMISYRKALKINPEFTVARFNLGALLQEQGLLQDAAAQYQSVVALQPGFYEAWVNWGAILQALGDLQAAEQCYRKALLLKTDATVYFNLGTNLYGQGLHQQAIEAFREALRLNPQFTSAWNDLGEIYRDQGEMDEAMRCYRAALAVDPGHDRANYNLGESFCIDGQLAQAIPYFAASGFADAAERVLYCQYKTGRFDTFKQLLDDFVARERHNSILLGCLSTHYAINFHQDNTYRFCRNPMDFVQHTEIPALSERNSSLLNELLDDVRHLAIVERKQGRLYYGIQSAGNLLQRSEPSFRKLADLILAKVAAYQQHFTGCEDALIRLFPKQLQFASSWYLRMKKGGYLTSHIHEEGWISGCVYLQLPEKRDNHEGSFEYGVDGDDYPRLHDGFPNRIVDPKVGDLLLFPSSLFHRTLPFHSEQERICIAFDIKP